MAKELKVIFDTHNETIRINCDGLEIESWSSKILTWEEKKDQAGRYVLEFMRKEKKAFIYYESWF